MTGSPLPRRASDADRERIVHVLQEAAVDGRLSQDSFVERVDQALRARDERSLSALVADLARPGGLSMLAAGVGSFVERLRPQGSTPTLTLPRAADPVLRVGRSRASDLVVQEGTVSRTHAVLMLFAGQWFLTDPGSTNGTRVNGRRVWGTTAVCPGDLVSFGLATFRLVRPAD